MADIRKRKKELEDDLELLEGNFETRISNVQQKVLRTLKPASYIKNNPLKAVGTSIVVGLIIGMMGDNNSSEQDEGSAVHKEKLSNILFKEIKKVAARKAAIFLSDFIDERFLHKK